MAGYIEDLVQNIYTYCDTKGFDALNLGLKNAISYSKDLESQLKSLQVINQRSYNFQTRAINAQKEAMQTERLLHTQTTNAQKEAMLSEKQKMRLIELESNMRQRMADKEDIYARRRERRDNAAMARMRKANTLRTFLTRSVGYFLGFAALRGLFNTSREGDLLQQSIEGLTKSPEDWQYIRNESYRTGTNIKTTAQGYKNFYASANMAGFSKESIQNMYSSVLTSTRAIGASPEQAKGALLALEQMISKGTISMEELRRQMGNAVPGAFEIGARAMKMTTKELNDLVKSGKLASNVFVPRFIAQMEKELGGGFDRMKQTLDYAATNLGTAWWELQREIMGGDTGKELAKVVTSITAVIKSEDFRTFIRVTSKFLSKVIDVVGWIIRHLDFIFVVLFAVGIVKIMNISNLTFKILWTVLHLKKSLIETTLVTTFLEQGFNAAAIAAWDMLKPILVMIGQVTVLIGLLMVAQDIWMSLDPNNQTITGDLVKKGFKSGGALSTPGKRVATKAGVLLGGAGAGATVGAATGGLLIPAVGAVPGALVGTIMGLVGGVGVNQTIAQYEKIYVPKKPKKPPKNKKAKYDANGQLLNYDGGTETKVASLTMGDINITTTGGDPQQIATAVQDALMNMMVAQQNAIV